MMNFVFKMMNFVLKWHLEEADRSRSPEVDLPSGGIDLSLLEPRLSSVAPTKPCRCILV